LVEFQLDVVFFQMAVFFRLSSFIHVWGNRVKLWMPVMH
jgi:hypothetical protein